NPAFITDGAAPAVAPTGRDKVVKDISATASAVIGGGGPMAQFEGAIVREPILAGEPMIELKVVRGGEGGYLAGLTRIDLAVFELPSGSPLDLGRMPQKGWDKVLQAREGPFNLLVLVRTGGRSLRDLAVFAQGENQLLYGRQKGSLAPDLPSTLQSVLRTTGLAGLKEHLLSSAQDSQAPRSP
ncbi:MAG TPA: hypothetical protein PLO68_06550, partial [Sedimentisphaerales bacterium]|nr:hypothetical protein [Sedimentisphaerales bacterium]